MKASKEIIVVGQIELTEAEQKMILANRQKKAKGQSAKDKERQAIADKKAEDKERLNAEKICAKNSYKGLFNIFNEVRKIGTFSAVRVGGQKFHRPTILGGLNFNQFVKQVTLHGVYTFDEIFNLCKAYQNSTPENRLVIAERGEIVNGLIMDVKGGKITPLEAIEKFVERFGLPYKVQKDGTKKVLVNKSTANTLEAIESPLYHVLGCAELFPIVEPGTTEIEVVDEIEA